MNALSAREGDRVPLSLDEVRGRQLELLDAIISHCDSLRLRVYLAHGSLLGAVRHQGFIPWDDDVDVMLPRSDFERFCSTFPAGRAQVSLRAPGLTPGHPLPYAKVCDDETELDNESDLITDLGVFVDVFPMDGWHNWRTIRLLQRALLVSLEQVFRAKHLSLTRKRPGLRNHALRAAKACALLIPTRLLVAVVTRVARLGSYDRSEEVGIIAWGYRESVPRSAMGDARSLPFEGAHLPCPADPDAVLRALYGNYQELPPEHERVTHHRFTAYLAPR